MSTINIEDLTSGLVNGDGVFDKLMEATDLRLQDAFTKNRISASDYSNILIQGIATSMQQSIAYLLGVQQADVQAELTKAQTLLIAQELENSLIQKTLLDKQVLQADENLTQSVAQTAIVIEGLLTAQADTALKVQQRTNLINVDLKVVTDIEVLEQQLINLAADKLKIDADIELIDQNVANALITGLVLTNQVDKLQAEEALLTQKTVTELAQTSNVADPESMIGKQITLYQKQSDGFERDAEQKAAKMLLDTWSIRQSTDGALAAPAGISDSSIKDVVNTLKLGVSTSTTEIAITLPGAKKTGATTGTGTVVTEDATGNIYMLVDTNASATAGAVINDDNTQAITEVGIQTIGIAGLTTATTYYAHFVQITFAGIITEVTSSNAFTTD